MAKKLFFLCFIFSFCFVNAQTFTVDGINYEVTSGTNVKVVATSFSGDNLVIPEIVNNSSTDYTVTMIDNSAFNSSFGLLSVVIPNSVTSIGANAFDSCISMTSLDLGDSVVSIGDFAFQSCGALTNLNLPNSLETIGANAFQYCLGLPSITIPDSVKTIGDSAFYGCENVTSISIGNSVTAIENNAFGYQESNSTLTSVSCAITTPLSINANVFSNRVLGACSLTVLPSSLSAYETADVWKDFNPINGTLSTKNVSILDQLQIYPNPTQKTLFIEVRNINNVKVEVYDMLGKKQLDLSLNNSVNTIDTEKLTSGIYLLKIISDEGTSSKKIIKN